MSTAENISPWFAELPSHRSHPRSRGLGPVLAPARPMSRVAEWCRQHWPLVGPGPELGLGRQGQWFQYCQGYNIVFLNSTIWLFSRWTLKYKRVFGRWWARCSGPCPLLYMLHVTCHKSDLCWIPIQHNNINSVLHEWAFKWLLTFLKAAIHLFVYFIYIFCYVLGLGG